MENRRDIQETAGVVLKLVSERHRCTPEELVGPTKPDRIAIARHMAFWLMRLRRFSYQDIGAIFNRTHATVLNGCRRVDGYFDIDSSWQQRWPEYAKYRCKEVDPIRKPPRKRKTQEAAA